MSEGSNLGRYAAALLSVGLAILVRRLLDPFLGNSLALVTLYGGVAAAVCIGRWQPGAIAAIAGYIATYYWLIMSKGEIRLTLADLAGFSGYALSCGIIIYTGELMHRARDRAQLEIAERKRAQDALQSREAELQAVVNATPFLLTRCSRDLRYRFVSRTYAEMIGREPDDIVGRPILEVMGDEGFRTIHPHIEKVLDGHRVEYEAEVHFESAGRRFLHVLYTPETDNSGAVTGWVGSIRDLTLRKRAEEEREKFVALVEQSDDFIGMGGLDGNVIYINRAGCRLVGLDPAEAPGTPIAFFHPEKWWIKLRDQIFPAIMREETNWVGEAQLRHVQTGEPIDVLMNVFSVRHARTNEILCYATVMRDITDRKRIEREREQLLDREQGLRRQAEAAGRIKDEFLATVSHELRTPLNSILGWASMLRAGQLQKPIVPRAIEAIERNARLQAQLIEDLLDVSRIISGKLPLNMKSVDVGPIVRSAVDSIRPAAHAKQIRLQVIVDYNAGTVAADEGRLQQIIWNLLSNSVKFTPSGGSVELSVGRAESGVCISVSDTGQGIKREFLPFVFDRFQQEDPSITRIHGGLGLGLAIARHLVELHGGTIAASSEGEGRGATFTVSLPSVSEASHSIGYRPGSNGAAAQTTNQAVMPDLSGITVLAIDDAEDTRQLLQHLVSQCGADIITASSANEGLQVMTADSPDIIICDIGMPEEDGYSFIRKARTLWQPNSTTIPAIALTGYVRVEDRMRALEAGYQMFVPKPVEPSELLRIVATLVGRTTEKPQAAFPNK